MAYCKLLELGIDVDLHVNINTNRIIVSHKNTL